MGFQNVFMYILFVESFCYTRLNIVIELIRTRITFYFSLDVRVTVNFKFRYNLTFPLVTVKRQI